MAERNEQITPSPESQVKNRLFWPLLIALLIACAVLGKAWLQKQSTPLPPSVSPTPKGAEPFNLLITKAIDQRQRLEVCEATFEHWKLHTVKRDIVSIREGSLTDRVTSVAPDWLKNQVLENSYNQSRAQIITRCDAIVEFEVDFADPDAWSIQIDGDAAAVTAPALTATDVNVPPESLQGWVVAEDFIISGKTEKNKLLRRVRQDLLKHVKKREFRDKYRAECRSGLATFFLNLFQAMQDPRLQKVRHVSIKFADDPQAD